MLAALLAASPSVAADLLASEYRSDGMFGVE
jgi:hypothetical protein